jgi:spermidine/putrescine transport system substrate-binding protein
MPPTAMPTAVPTAGATVEPTKPQLATELHIFNWSEYIDPEIYAEFEQEFGVRLIEDTFASNEDLLAKLQAGATGYDIIVPSDYMVEIMIGQDMLATLDHNDLPNRGNLYAIFQDPPYDPDNSHCIPYQWGTTGIGYNNEDIAEPPDSWGYLFDPAMAAPYVGKMSMLNDSREVIGSALKYLGYSLNSTDPAQLEQAKQLLLQQKEWVTTYDSEQFEDLLSTGDTVIGQGWSGDYFMLAVEDERVSYTIPKEGGAIWADNLCIPRSSQNKYTAEVFINYLLQSEVAAKVSNFTWFASPVQTAEPHLNPDILNEPAIYPPEEVMAELEWIKDIGEATALYDRIWTELRSK